MSTKNWLMWNLNETLQKLPPEKSISDQATSLLDELLETDPPRDQSEKRLCFLLACQDWSSAFSDKVKRSGLLMRHGLSDDKDIMKWLEEQKQEKNHTLVQLSSQTNNTSTKRKKRSTKKKVKPTRATSTDATTMPITITKTSLSEEDGREIEKLLEDNLQMKKGKKPNKHSIDKGTKTKAFYKTLQAIPSFKDIKEEGKVRLIKIQGKNPEKLTKTLSQIGKNVIKVIVINVTQEPPEVYFKLRQKTGKTTIQWKQTITLQSFEMVTMTGIHHQQTMERYYVGRDAIGVNDGLLYVIEFTKK